MEKIEVGYWSIRGLGAPLRMMLMFGGPRPQYELQLVTYDIEYNADMEVNADCWFVPKVELKTQNPFINLPYAIDNDLLISQTNAIFAHLGRKLNLWGTDSLEVSLCEQLLCEIYDLRNKMVAFAYRQSQGAEGNSAEALALLENCAGAYLSYGACPFPNPPTSSCASDF